jgi:6-phosphogluconolactonase
VDPTGRFLYANDTISGTVLSALPGSPFAAGDGSDGLMVDPSSRFLYAANANSSNLSAFSIGADGSLTAMPGSPYAIAFGSTCSKRRLRAPTTTRSSRTDSNRA